MAQAWKQPPTGLCRWRSSGLCRGLMSFMPSGQSYREGVMKFVGEKEWVIDIFFTFAVADRCRDPVEGRAAGSGHNEMMRLLYAHS